MTVQRRKTNKARLGFIRSRAFPCYLSYPLLPDNGDLSLKYRRFVECIYCAIKSQI